MLSAQGQIQLGTGVLRSAVFLERRLRVHLIRRERLLFDSAYSPPARAATPFVHLFAQLSGTLQIAGRPPLATPCAVLLAESEFDRVTRGSLTFRSFGERATIVEVRVLEADIGRPIGLGHGSVALPAAVWAAFAALEAQPSESAVHALIASLGVAGVLSPALLASVVAEEPERFRRVWAVLEPLYQNLATSASLKQIAGLTGLSLRQLGRDLTDLTRTFGLFGAGFRDAMRVLRLRAAVLMLSAPDATPNDVARMVGYGSLDAMGRAFRDARLPPPSIVQHAVRFRELEPRPEPTTDSAGIGEPGVIIDTEARTST